MGQAGKRIRYGARSLDELRNREVEATAVKTWANTLVAIYETDPEAIAAVLPPFLTAPAEPLVRLTIATVDVGRGYPRFGARSEEHTSELQSPDHLVCRLLLEKKK